MPGIKKKTCSGSKTLLKFCVIERVTWRVREELLTSKLVVLILWFTIRCVCVCVCVCVPVLCSRAHTLCEWAHCVCVSAQACWPGRPGWVCSGCRWVDWRSYGPPHCSRAAPEPTGSSSQTLNWTKEILNIPTILGVNNNMEICFTSWTTLLRGEGEPVSLMSRLLNSLRVIPDF